MDMTTDSVVLHSAPMAWCARMFAILSVILGAVYYAWGLIEGKPPDSIGLIVESAAVATFAFLLFLMVSSYYAGRTYTFCNGSVQCEKRGKLLWKIAMQDIAHVSLSGGSKAGVRIQTRNGKKYYIVTLNKDCTTMYQALLEQCSSET